MLLSRDTVKNDDNAHPLPALQSSFQTVYGIMEATTDLSLGSPSSWSTSNVIHPNRSLNDIKNGKPYSSSSARSSHESPPLTDNHHFQISKNEVSSFPSSHNQDHAVLPSILQVINLLKRYNPAIILQNSGSVARDHLASERTFLAYVHTSLALSNAGIGIVQLLTIAELIFPEPSEIPMEEVSRRMEMKRFAKPLGVLTQVLALNILLLGEFFFFLQVLR